RSEDPLAVGGGPVDRLTEHLLLFPELDDLALERGHVYVGLHLAEHGTSTFPTGSSRTKKAPQATRSVGAPVCGSRRGTTQLRPDLAVRTLTTTPAVTYAARESPARYVCLTAPSTRALPAY